MILSHFNLRNIDTNNVDVPDESIFLLPERVLQFGTGILLRGLPDYFIDKANKKGIFNGRIVMVKSTNTGDSAAFDKQDGLYTHCIRGLENGEQKEENIINASVSRVLSASTQWEQILDCAHDMNMKVIISNTTEIGIQLVHEDIRKHPPVSFPGKLLSFLLERYHAFIGSKESGMCIIPTELITDNGTKLEAILLELAHLNGIEAGFIEWLENCNHFCNSLVDRIVPGKPDAAFQKELETSLGFQDQLTIISEPYRLWAIEGNEDIRSILSFAQADDGIVIAPDIEVYRELKLRLLNGTHTLACGLSFLSGLATVKDAMENIDLRAYITRVMEEEITPAIPCYVDPSVARNFIQTVLDRFGNAQIRHQWLTITTQYSSKMKMRIIPLLIKHYEHHDEVPELMALGFAAYLYFMKVSSVSEGKYFGELDGKVYPVNDTQAALFMTMWKQGSSEEVVTEVMRDSTFWGKDLSLLPGFSEAVLDKLNRISTDDVLETIRSSMAKKVLVYNES